MRASCVSVHGAAARPSREVLQRSLPAGGRQDRASLRLPAPPLPLEGRKAPSEPFGNSGQQPPRPASACRKRPFTTHADRLPRLRVRRPRRPLRTKSTAGPLVGTGLTGRNAARTLESLCFAGSAPGLSCLLSYARLWRAWGRAPSKYQPTPTPIRTRPRMSSTTRRHTGSKVPGRPPSRPSRSVWSANGLARGGHPLSASLTMRLPSTRYGWRSLTASGRCRGRGPHSPRFAGRPL